MTKSLLQEYINAYRGLPNKFEQLTGVPHNLVMSQSAIGNNNNLRGDYGLSNGLTVLEYLCQKGQQIK